MPLMQGKSKQAFSHNVGAEMDSGKPQKQALAIAYAIKRNKKAKGGEVGDMDQTKMDPMDDINSADIQQTEDLDLQGFDENDSKRKPISVMASNGMRDSKSIAQAIMKSKNYEKGGMVDDFLSPEDEDLGPMGEGMEEHDREDHMTEESPRKSLLKKIMMNMR